MATTKKFEIERKFLVISGSFKDLASSNIDIKQGYLNKDPHRTVRVRTKGTRGFITIKGLTQGCKREEYEYEIPYADALNILEMTLPCVISKTRWLVPYDDFTWEIDEFHNNLQGLILAEIELPSEDTKFSLPPFIGEEVTHDSKYFNSSLSDYSC